MIEHTNEFVDILINQGFAIAVAVYLLWERGRFNQHIATTMSEIAVTLHERLPDMRGF